MTTVTTSATERRAVPPTRDPVIWVWAAAAFVSFVGDSVWLVGLAWAAVSAASPAVAGVVVAVGMAPQALLLLVGGSLADRLDGRRVMLGANAVRVVTLVAGAAAWQSGAPRVPVLVAVACVFGAADAFYLPASATLPRQMVPPEDLATLAGLFQVVRRAAAFTGAALGGWIAATQGLVAAMVIDAVGFVVISVAVAAVLRPRFPLARSAAEPVLRAIRSGIGYVRADHTVRTLTVTLSGLNVFVGPALSLGVALRADASAWGAGAVGSANACVGVCAALGALAAMRLRPRRPAVSGFLALVVQGIGIAAIGIGWMPAMLAGAAVIGTTAGYASVLLSATFQQVIREDQLGRVQSLTMLSDYTLLPLATPLFGWLAAGTSIGATATRLRPRHGGAQRLGSEPPGHPGAGPRPRSDAAVDQVDRRPPGADAAPLEPRARTIRPALVDPAHEQRFRVQHIDHLLGVRPPVGGQPPPRPAHQARRGDCGERGIDQPAAVVALLGPGVGEEGPQLADALRREQVRERPHRVDADQADVVDLLLLQGQEGLGHARAPHLEREHVELGPADGQRCRRLADARPDLDHQRGLPTETLRPGEVGVVDGLVGDPPLPGPALPDTRLGVGQPAPAAAVGEHLADPAAVRGDAGVGSRRADAVVGCGGFCVHAASSLCRVGSVK